MADRFDKFDKSEKMGRPAKEDSDKKTKKVLLSMTERRYEQMQHYQQMFGKKTLTSTIEYLMERGEEKVRDDLERFRER